MAYFLVQSLAFLIASCSLIFHSSATSFAKGSSGFGAERRAWIDRSTVRICKAGLHLSGMKEAGSFTFSSVIYFRYSWDTIKTVHIKRRYYHYTGCPKWAETGFSWLWFRMPNSARADGNLAEAAGQLGKMVEHRNQSQPNPGLRSLGTPCSPSAVCLLDGRFRKTWQSVVFRTLSVRVVS